MNHAEAAKRLNAELGLAKGGRVYVAAPTTVNGDILTVRFAGGLTEDQARALVALALEMGVGR